MFMCPLDLVVYLNVSLQVRVSFILGDRSEKIQVWVGLFPTTRPRPCNLDGDGLKDIVVGKRLWEQGPTGDVEPNEAPVLYWFQLNRDGKGGAMFVPHLIDDKSAVGV